MADTLMKQGADLSPLPRKDYTLALLRRAALTGSIPEEKLIEIERGLHDAVAERAAAYTRGKSMAVTRAQAEAFYLSVLSQLDAVLLTLPDDAEAETVLREQDFSDLLTEGQSRTLEFYEKAKDLFRRAYKATKPVQTSFFHALLPDFEQFCTKYDARFRANETKVQFSYPLLGGVQITENGVIGVLRYYSALYDESRLLSLFDADDVNGMMQRYADKFLTAKEQIAENIAELVLRHWLVRALCGDSSFAVTVTAEQLDAAAAEYAAAPAEKLAADMRKIAEQSKIAEDAALLRYVNAALPYLAEVITERIAVGRLAGWFGTL
jgi:hypothetical protein